MELLLAAAYTAFFVFLIGKLTFYSFGEVSPARMKLFFLFKVAAGVSLYLVYTYYYTDRLTADTFKYFDDSAVIFDLFSRDRSLFLQFMFGGGQPGGDYLHYSNLMNTWWNKYALYNDARTMIRLNVILRFISLGYYHVHGVIFAFISFTGLVALARVLTNELKHFRRAFLHLLFLFPSLAFWSSGVMKDGLIFFTLGFCMLFLSKILSGNNPNSRRYLWLAACMILLFFTKLHIFFLFLAGGLAWIWSSRSTRLHWLYYAVSLFVTLSASALTLQAVKGYSLWNWAAEKQHESIRAAEAVKAGSLISIGQLDGSLGSILRNAPEGFINALLRPAFTDRQSAVILVATLENLFLFLLILATAVSLKPLRTERSPLFYFSACYVVVLFTLVGIMTPVLGALVRYKIQGLPFLFFVLFTLADRDKALKRLPFLRYFLK